MLATSGDNSAPDQFREEPVSHENISSDDPIVSRRTYWAVFLISMGVLLLEISLTRIFSYTIWYHFAYVTISLAMLGFGASGAFLAASEKFTELPPNHLAKWSSVCAAVSVPLMLVAISKVPFQSFEIFRNPIQIVYMIFYCLTVATPFFFGGLTIACVFKSAPPLAGRIYFWDLLGAGAGCLVAVSAINFLQVPAVACITATLFLGAAALFFSHTAASKAIALALAAVVWMPLSANVEKAITFKPNSEKWISKLENKEVTFSKWTPIFRVDVFDMFDDVHTHPWEGVIFGIPNEKLPPDTRYSLISHDGDACTMMLKSDSELSLYEHFGTSILKPPYLILDKPDVLIIGPGGGVEVGMAVKSGAASVKAIELDPQTVDIVKNRYADFVGQIYSKPGVNAIADEGRSFLRRSEQKFDLIEEKEVDTLAARHAGAYVLAENYLYTQEAYGEYFDHLNPDGILCSVTFETRKRFPRHVARRISLAVDTLEKRGIADPSRHMAVMASSRTSSEPYVSIMTKMSPFTPAEVLKLASFAEKNAFDIWHLPGKLADNPCARIITSNREERWEYFKNHALKLTPPSDDSPFFFDFYKWSTILSDRPVDPRHATATSKLILLLLLVLSVCLSGALIILPLLKFQASGLQIHNRWNYILYFAGLGFGFIFLEISYIQKFILFLGYPTYALTVILFSVLTFSGVGSYVSGRLPLRPRRIVLLAVILLAIVALGYMKFLPIVFDQFLGSPRYFRIAISLLLLFPLGLLLGMFFPTGIRMISTEHARFVPWAWGINGCASVVGTIVTIVIAMSYGFRVVTVLAVAIYFAAVASIVLTRSE